MKKTINVNIAGTVFTLDEDAYKLLYDYIEALHNAFAKDEEGGEIVNDIEYRISEILTELINVGQNVITIEDIENLITRIGNPEEIIEVEVDINDELPPSPPPYNGVNTSYPEIKKKMYRDTQNSMIGGVCSGLAAYFGVDVVWIRIAFILLSLFKGIGFVIYIVLWIATPAAVTPFQRMEMTGEKPTIRNIGRNVTDTFMSDKEGVSTGNMQNRSGFGSFLRVCVNIISIFLLVILIPIVLALAIGILGCVIALMFAVPALFGFNTLYDGGEGINIIATSLWCAISYIITIGIPLFLLTSVILSNFKIGNTIFNARSRWTWLTVWIIGLVMAIISTTLLVTDRNNNMRNITKDIVLIESVDNPSPTDGE